MGNLLWALAPLLLALVFFVVGLTAKKDKKTGWYVGTFFAVIIAGLVGFTPFFGTQTSITTGTGALTSGGVQVGAGGGQPIIITASDPNDPNLQGTVNLASLNVESTATDYQAASVRLLDENNVQLATGTLTGGTALSYLSTGSLPRNTKGTVVLLGDTSYAGATDTFDTTKTPFSKTLKSGNTSRLAGFWRTSAFANDTAAEDAHTNSLSLAPTTATHTLGANGVLNFKLEVIENGTAAAYGGTKYMKVPLPLTDPIYDQNDDKFPDGGVLITVDLTLTESSANAFSLSSGNALWPLTRLDRCPSDANKNGSPDVCYIAPTLTSSMGLQTLSGTYTADIANPATDVNVDFDDIVPFSDTDGVIRVGVANKAATDQGATRLRADIDIA